MELSIIKLLMSKDNFTKFMKYVKFLMFEPELDLILKLIHAYYNAYDSSHVTVDDLLAMFNHQYPAIRDKEKYIDLIKRLAILEVNPDLAADMLMGQVQKQVASNIAKVCLDSLDTAQTDFTQLVNKELEELTALDKSINTESPFVEDDINELLKEECSKDGINWRMACLNNDLGMLRGGSLGAIFARVDTGKTSFLASEVSHFASQLKDDEIIVWANNEEKGSKVKLRIASSLTGLTKDNMQSDPDNAQAAYLSLGGSKIKLYDSAVITMYDLDRILKSFNVRILVIDQGDKLIIPGKWDKNTDRLTAIYQRLRELVKTYPKLDILAAGQASAEAANKKWLQLDWMSESKTGKPGELDYAVGIGAQIESPDTRYITICKNKMHNGNHGQWVVAFDHNIGRYYDS